VQSAAGAEDGSVNSTNNLTLCSVPDEREIDISRASLIIQLANVRHKFCRLYSLQACHSMHCT